MDAETAKPVNHFFDLFKLEPNGTRTWRGGYESFEEALTRALEFTFREHADFFVSDVRTREQIPVPFIIN